MTIDRPRYQVKADGTLGLVPIPPICAFGHDYELVDTRDSFLRETDMKTTRFYDIICHQCGNCRTVSPA